jgi:hypothetical protein
MTNKFARLLLLATFLPIVTPTLAAESCKHHFKETVGAIANQPVQTADGRTFGRFWGQPLGIGGLEQTQKTLRLVEAQRANVFNQIFNVMPTPPHDADQSAFFQHPQQGLVVWGKAGCAIAVSIINPGGTFTIDPEHYMIAPGQFVLPE